MTAEMGSDMDFGNVKQAINVIDVRQSYEQSIMRVMFALLGHEGISNGIVHLAYGPVNLEGAKLSGRKGNWLGFTADDLLRETSARVKEVMGESTKKIELSRSKRG